MSWTYRQHDGSLFDAENKRVAIGYSGFGHGKDDPTDDDVRGVGPIPCGKWRMTALEERHPKLGPYVIHLKPEPGTDTHGRDGFRIHGDSLTAPGQASHGCIILPRPIREALWQSVDHDILVVP